MSKERVGILILTGWHGRTEHIVKIIGETPKRYRIEITDGTVHLPSRRVVRKGETALVPKTAVKMTD